MFRSQNDGAREMDVITSKECQNKQRLMLMSGQHVKGEDNFYVAYSR